MGDDTLRTLRFTYRLCSGFVLTFSIVHLQRNTSFYSSLFSIVTEVPRTSDLLRKFKEESKASKAFI